MSKKPLSIESPQPIAASQGNRVVFEESRRNTERARLRAELLRRILRSEARRHGACAVTVREAVVGRGNMD